MFIIAVMIVFLLANFHCSKPMDLIFFFMEVSLAPLQVRLLMLKKNKKKRTESIREGKESPMKDMQARTKSPKSSTCPQSTAARACILCGAQRGTLILDFLG